MLFKFCSIQEIDNSIWLNLQYFLVSSVRNCNFCVKILHLSFGFNFFSLIWRKYSAWYSRAFGGFWRDRSPNNCILPNWLVLKLSISQCYGSQGSMKYCKIWSKGKLVWSNPNLSSNCWMSSLNTPYKFNPKSAVMKI